MEHEADDARQEVCELREEFDTLLEESAAFMGIDLRAEAKLCIYHPDMACISCDLCECATEDDGQPSQYEELQDVFGGDDSYYPDLDENPLGDYDLGE